MIKISVIIVLYNEFDLIKKTLASVYGNGFKDIEVILSDNSSDKKGYLNVIKKFPKVIHIQNKSNLGFGAAVNVGAKKAKGTYLLILTPDMYLLPKTIKTTYDFIERDQEIGLIGSRIFSAPGKQEQSILYRYPNIVTLLYYFNIPYFKIVSRIYKKYSPMYFSLLNHKQVNFPIAVSGQYMLIRKKAFLQCLFDKRFYLYFEDIDLCKSLLAKNWKIVYLPEGGTVQNGISKWKNNNRITQALPFYMESMYKFFAKHYGKGYTVVSFIIGLISALASIPYLFLVSVLKTTLGKKSQSTSLLPQWLNILSWHLTKGIFLIIKL
jgi:GT2 family glycosyltransferase